MTCVGPTACGLTNAASASGKYLSILCLNSKVCVLAQKDDSYSHACDLYFEKQPRAQSWNSTTTLFCVATEASALLHTVFCICLAALIVLNRWSKIDFSWFENSTSLQSLTQCGSMTTRLRPSWYADGRFVCLVLIQMRCHA